MKNLNILVIVSLVLIGVICYLVQAHLNAVQYPAWHTAMGNIDSAILICGLLTLFQNIITKHLEDANLRKFLGISTTVHDSRLINILHIRYQAGVQRYLFMRMLVRKAITR